MKRRAILMASHRNPEARADAGPLSSLGLLVDRPILHHVIEQLVYGGISSIHILAATGFKRVQAEVGTGERWGVSIACTHLASEGALYEALAQMTGFTEDEELLICHADAIVNFNEWANSSSSPAQVEAYCSGPASEGHTPRWTGWCSLTAAVLTRLGPLRSRAELLGSLIRSANEVHWTSCDTLFVDTPDALLAASDRLMSSQVPYITLRGRHQGSWIWRERGVHIHETATLHGPVYLGEHVEVAAGAVVGPNVVIGAKSIIDAGVRAHDCVIAPETYVRSRAKCEHVVGFERGFLRCAAGERSSEKGVTPFVNLRAVALVPNLHPILDTILAAIMLSVLAPFLIIGVVAASLRSTSFAQEAADTVPSQIVVS